MCFWCRRGIVGCQTIPPGVVVRLKLAGCFIYSAERAELLTSAVLTASSQHSLRLYQQTQRMGCM